MTVETPDRTRPRRPDELELLIREARRRQRRRRAFGAGVVTAAAAAVIAGYSVGSSGGKSPTPSASHPQAAALVTTRFAIGASSWHGRRWSGLVVADAASRRSVRSGQGGRTSSRRLTGRSRSGSTADSGCSSGEHRDFTSEAGRSRFGVPAGAAIAEPSSSHGRIVFDASWGNGRAGKLHSATFVYANGTTTKVRASPTPYGGVSEAPPAWSPDGSRIAFYEDGDLWTMAPDGSHAAD